MGVLIKLNIHIYPATLFLEIYQKELEVYVCKKTCTWMFTVALPIITENCKQPKCHYIGDRWIGCGVCLQYDNMQHLKGTKYWYIS